MQKTELTIFIIIGITVILVFVIGIILFLLNYYKRKIEHEQEKSVINKKHIEELLTTQLQSQQQTMQFIGREIHDNIGQKLTLASLYSKQLLSKTGNDTGTINTIGNIIDESLADLRQLSKSLTNPALADAPLAQLLQEEAVKINSLGSCFVQITDHTAGHSLSPAQKNILFRMLQEFIQNSLKHAACKKIKIVLQTVNNLFTITATDDGKGFDPAQKSNGQGLLNIQRRAEELPAGYELKSEPGKGTQLIIQLQIA